MTLRLTKFSILSYCFFKAFNLPGVVLPWWMTNWFADLLCLPVVLGIGLLFIRFHQADSHFFLRSGQIVYVFLLFSLTFEYFLPMKNESFTADPIDILMYAIGAFTFSAAQHFEEIMTGGNMKLHLTSKHSTPF